MFYMSKSNKETFLSKYIEPINLTLKGTWNLSRQFALPDDRFLSRPISLFNSVFGKLNVYITSILKSVVMLASNAPRLLQIAGTFKTECEIQEQNVIKISGAGVSMAERIEKVTDSIKTLTETANSIEKDVQSAMSLGDKSLQQIAGIKNIVGELVEVIKALNENAHSIGSIIEFINDVSDESNLLSLNAKIEASRSGVHGKGFGVIAEEMGQLARQTKDATVDINSKLSILREKVNDTVEAVDRVAKNVEAGESVINSSNTSLAEVYEKFSIFSENIRNINTSTENQNNDVKSVTNEIISIEAALKSQSAESKTLFKIVEDINGICDQIIVDTGIFHLSNHKKAQSMAEKLASLPEMQTNDRNRQEKIMEKAIDENPYSELVYLTNSSGTQITRNIYSQKARKESNAKGLNENWSHKEWFSIPKSTGQPYISKVYRSSATDNFCFTVSVPIYNNKEFKGILGIDVNIADLLNI